MSWPCVCSMRAPRSRAPIRSLCGVISYGRVEERRNAALGEAVVLRPQHDADVWARPCSRECSARAPRRAPRLTAGREADGPPCGGRVLRSRPADRGDRSRGSRARAAYRCRLRPRGSARTPERAGPRPEHVACLDLEAGPARHGGSVQGHRHVGTGDGNPARIGELDTRPGKRALEACRVVGIVHEAVGEEKGLAVQGSRGRNPHAQRAAPAQILDRRLRTRIVDEEIHAIT